MKSITDQDHDSSEKDENGARQTARNAVVRILQRAAWALTMTLLILGFKNRRSLTNLADVD